VKDRSSEAKDGRDYEVVACLQHPKNHRSNKGYGEETQFLFSNAKESGTMCVSWSEGDRGRDDMLTLPICSFFQIEAGFSSEHKPLDLL
jgi:hypothetical protein